MLQRARWAYIVAAIFAAIGFIGSLFQIISGSAMLRQLNQAADPSQAAISESVRSVTTFALFCALILQIIYVALFVFSYTDFFGTLRRFQIAFKHSAHATHYNNGVAY